MVSLFTTLGKILSAPASIGKSILQPAPSVGGVLSRVAIAGAALTGSLGAIAATAGKTVLSVVTKPQQALKTAGAVLGSITGATIIATSPTVQKAILKAPETAITVGKQISKVIEGDLPITSLAPSDVLKTAGLVGASVAVAGAGALLIPKLFEQSEQLLPTATTEQTLPTATTTPTAILPATTTLNKIPSGTGFKRKKRAVPKPLSVSQRVNIKVNTRQTQKYIKNCCY